MIHVVGPTHLSAPTLSTRLDLEPPIHFPLSVLQSPHWLLPSPRRRLAGGEDPGSIPPVARPEREGSGSTRMLRRRGEGAQGMGSQACLSSALLGFAVGRPLFRARDSGGTWQQPLPLVRKHPGGGAFLAAIASVRARHHQLPPHLLLFFVPGLGVHVSSRPLFRVSLSLHSLVFLSDSPS
jgi:hypothetical protein